MFFGVLLFFFLFLFSFLSQATIVIFFQVNLLIFYFSFSCVAHISFGGFLSLSLSLSLSHTHTHSLSYHHLLCLTLTLTQLKPTHTLSLYLIVFLPCLTLILLLFSGVRSTGGILNSQFHYWAKHFKFYQKKEQTSNLIHFVDRVPHFWCGWLDRVSYFSYKKSLQSRTSIYVKVGTDKPLARLKVVRRLSVDEGQVLRSGILGY